MTVDQILQQEIKHPQNWLSRGKDESTCKRDLKKRSELIHWVLQNMKNPNVEVRNLVESRRDSNYTGIKKVDLIFESDILDSELRIFIGYSTKYI